MHEPNYKQMLDMHLTDTEDASWTMVQTGGFQSQVDLAH
jgi:hypothetical protein